MLQIIQEESQVKLTFFHPHEPSSSFKYPGTQDIRIVPIDDILTLVDPRTRIGRTYSLSNKELTSTREKFCIVSVNFVFSAVCNV